MSNDEEVPTDLGRAQHAPRLRTGELPGAFRVLADVTPSWWGTAAPPQMGQGTGRALSHPLVTAVRTSRARLEVEMLCPPGLGGEAIGSHVEEVARLVSAPSVGRGPGW